MNLPLARNVKPKYPLAKPFSVFPDWIVRKYASSRPLFRPPVRPLPRKKKR